MQRAERTSARPLRDQVPDRCGGHRLDLTGAAAAEIVDLTEAGDTVKAVPFTATVDGEGRLTALDVSIPAIGEVDAFTYRVTYTYDAATAVEAPAATEVAETPDALYELLG